MHDTSGTSTYSQFTTKTDGVDVTNPSITVYAHWDNKTYNVNLCIPTANAKNDYNNGYTYQTRQEIFDNEFKNIYTPTKTGYVFIDWYTKPTGGKVVRNGDDFDMSVYSDLSNKNENTSEIYLYSHWQVKTYTIKYDVNKGTGSTTPDAKEDQSIVFDTTFTSANVSVIARHGYTFAGWWTGTGSADNGEAIIEGGTPFNTTLFGKFDTKSDINSQTGSSITLYAHWTTNPYTIRYDNNGGEGSMADTPCTFDQEVTIATHTFTRNGYYFVGWKREGDDTIYNDGQVGMFNFVPSGVQTLYAQWAVKQYAIHYDGNKGAGSSTPTSKTNQYIIFNDQFTAENVTAISRTGYDFAGWWTGIETENEVQVEENTTFDMTLYNKFDDKHDVDAYTGSYITLYAHWTARKYTATVIFNDIDNGNGSTYAMRKTESEPKDESYPTITIENIEFDKDDGFVMPALKRKGYIFLGYKNENQSRDYIGGQWTSENNIICTFNDDLYTTDIGVENISESTNGGSFNIKAMWQAITYKIVVDRVDAGSSPAYGSTYANKAEESDYATQSTVKEIVVADVVFDHDVYTFSFPDLKRHGYTFNGYTTQTDISITLGSKSGYNRVGKFNLAFFNNYNLTNDIDPVSKKSSFIIKAAWEAIIYDITIYYNDLNDGTGSTYANEIQADGYTTVNKGPKTAQVTFDQPIKFDALKRIGHNFKGYYYQKVGLNNTSWDKTKIDVLSGDGNYIVGISGYNGDKLSNQLVQATGLYLDDTLKTCRIYAIWESQTFKAYVNLNNTLLDGYNKDDFDFTVKDGGVVKYTNSSDKTSPYTSYTVDWKFDCKIDSLPTIEANGYTFAGFYAKDNFENALKSVSDATADPSQATILNKVLFDILTYQDSSVSTTNTKDMYMDNKLIFSMYARYNQNTYTLSLSGENILKGYNLVTMKDNGMVDRYYEIGNYDYTGIYGSSNNSISVLSHRYALADLWAPDGHYIKQIKIDGTLYSFTWDSANQQVKYNDVVVNEEGIQLKDHVTKAFSSIMVKAIYNATGDHVSTDTPRIIILIDNFMKDITIEISQVEIQTYEVKYYRYAVGSESCDEVNKKQDLLFTRIYSYNTQLTTANDFAYPYTKGFVFDAWYYGSVTGNVPNDPTSGMPNAVTFDSDVVREDKVLVANYEATVGSRNQVVNFWIWDNIAG